MDWLKISFIILIFGIIFLRLRKVLAHRKAIGQKVAITYVEHNEDFELILPLIAVISHKIKIAGVEYFVLETQRSFTYGYRPHSFIIVKERLAGRYIGMSGEIDVQVLLPKGEMDGTEFDRDDFEPVAWASVKILV